MVSERIFRSGGSKRTFDKPYRLAKWKHINRLDPVARTCKGKISALIRYWIELHPIAQPISSKYINTIAAIAARFVDEDEDSSSNATLIVRKIEIYNRVIS